MKVTRNLVEVQLRFLENDIKDYKQAKDQKQRPHSSITGLLDYTIFILGNIQLLSDDLEFDRNDVLFKRAIELQRQIRLLER